MTDWSGRTPNVNSMNAPVAAGDQWQPQQEAPAGCRPSPEPAPSGWQPDHQPPPAPGWGAPQPSPYSGFPGSQPPIPGTTPGPTSPRSRKPLWITLAAGAAVITVVAIVLVITTSGGTRPGAPGGSAGDAVKAYLQALARGDAEAALSYGIDQPATKEFLTDDILRKQIAKWPISNIRILNDDSSSAGFLGMAQVHVVANFGDKNSDTTLHVKNDHGTWKLDTAAVKINPAPGTTSGNAAANTVAFFGKPIGESAAYVFPGWIDAGSTNPYLKVDAKPILLDQLSLYGMAFLQADITVSDKGHQAAAAQLDAALAICQHSNQLAPPGCPMNLDPYGYTEGTVTWGVPDTSAVEIDRFNPYQLQLSLTGEVKIPVTVKTTSGGTKQGISEKFILGTADLAKTPPALSFH